MRNFLKQELSGWQRWEVIYGVCCTTAIMVISIILGDNALGIASAVTGTLYTLLAGKGKISCYIFGIFNSASYGYIACKNTLYGDAMLNICWYLPMMFAGIIFWRKKLDDQGCAIKKRLSLKGRVITLFAGMMMIALYAYFLNMLGDRQPLVDSATTILSVIAMILTVKRCVEQWLMWILVNAISVVMWLRVYLENGNSAATLLWWLIMLITGIIFFIQWSKDIRSGNKNNI